MSTVAVTAALEARLATMSPDLATAWENEEFDPATEVAAGDPYQRVTVLFAEPDNAEISASYLERGFMQIDLFFPEEEGAGAARARADQVRTTFARGVSLTSGGVVTTIDRTPEILPGRQDEGRFRIPIRVRFFAQITA